MAGMNYPSLRIHKKVVQTTEGIFSVFYLFIEGLAFQPPAL